MQGPLWLRRRRAGAGPGYQDDLDADPLGLRANPEELSREIRWREQFKAEHVPVEGQRLLHVLHKQDDLSELRIPGGLPSPGRGGGCWTTSRALVDADDSAVRVPAEPHRLVAAVLATVLVRVRDPDADEDLEEPAGGMHSPRASRRCSVSSLAAGPTG